MYSPHGRAVLEALFVTFLWSTSWVLIKIGLADVPALTFAGLRYTLAFVCLCPLLALNASHRSALRALSGRQWLRLLALGTIFITVTQGAQFVSLTYLPAATISLMLNFSAVIVALLGIPLLAERPTPLQWGGMGLFLLGVLVYFYPILLPSDQAPGFAAACIGVVGTSVSSVLGRDINREGKITPFIVTLVSIGAGGIMLLAVGVAVNGLPVLTLSHWAIIGWLALVNTALAFILWNRTLRTLSATESSLINNTMLIQIALLAWLFLAEPLNGQELAGLAVSALGVLLVQLRPGIVGRVRMAA
jgi:drug/metabolite transporter (DMT)-like permease